jgi:hypothetical protein
LNAEPVGSLSFFLFLQKAINTPVKIANPVQGGKSYTSAKRAIHFLKCGRAELTQDGELFFYTAESVLRRKQDELEATILDRHRKGIIYWNGSGDPSRMHRPGEARS